MTWTDLQSDWYKKIPHGAEGRKRTVPSQRVARDYLLKTIVYIIIRVSNDVIVLIKCEGSIWCIQHGITGRLGRRLHQTLCNALKVYHQD